MVWLNGTHNRCIQNKHNKMLICNAKTWIAQTKHIYHWKVSFSCEFIIIIIIIITIIITINVHLSKSSDWLNLFGQQIEWIKRSLRVVWKLSALCALCTRIISFSLFNFNVNQCRASLATKVASHRRVSAQYMQI